MAEVRAEESSPTEVREISLLVAHNTPAELALRVIRLRREVRALQTLIHLGEPDE